MIAPLPPLAVTGTDYRLAAWIDEGDPLRIALTVGVEEITEACRRIVKLAERIG